MPKVTECPTLSTRSYCVFTPLGFVTKYFLIFIIDEVKNFAANNIFKLLELVTYWETCIIGQSRTEICAKRGCSYIEKFKGSKEVEGFCCKFFYWDCSFQEQRFCIRSEASLFYNGLLFEKVSPPPPQVFFTVKLVCLIGFSRSSYLVFIYFSAMHDIDMILMFVFFFFNKVYSE